MNRKMPKSLSLIEFMEEACWSMHFTQKEAMMMIVGEWFNIINCGKEEELGGFSHIMSDGFVL